MILLQLEVVLYEVSRRKEFTLQSEQGIRKLATIEQIEDVTCMTSSERTNLLNLVFPIGVKLRRRAVECEENVLPDLESSELDRLFDDAERLVRRLEVRRESTLITQILCREAFLLHKELAELVVHPAVTSVQDETRLE